MKKWRLVINVALCESCHNCLLACKDEHVGNDWPGYTDPQQLHGGNWIWIAKRERGSYPHVDVAYRPTPCMHCEDPACARAAPDAVMRRADGIVLIDPVKAKGRKDLVDSCPYGAIQWNDELEVCQKCTLCAHLLDDGWSKPRCVQACPTGALQIVKVDKAEAARMIEADRLETLHPEFNTKPNVLYANMYRYASCFVAGSVARREGEAEDCVKGASVRLFRDSAQIAETTTDAFGDFRFDGLPLNETGLSVMVQAPGCRERRLEIAALSESVNAGVVLLDGAA
jgi:Fe-S-cluster-containing dehydrogenase component